MNLDLINALRNVLPALAPHDRDFATSLLDQYGRKGALSDKQWPWVAKLVEKATPAPAAPKAQIGEMAGLIALFDRAKENGIKYPKIKIDCEGQDVVLSMASDFSKYAGDLNVTSPGSFNARTWYGRVGRDGAMTLTTRNPIPAGLVSTLSALAADPSQAGAAHGKRTGNCCFCSRLLETKRSLAVGYGPICAERWGLDW